MERQLRELSMQTLLSPSELPALRKYRDLLDAKIEELEREGVTGLDGKTMRQRGGADINHQGDGARGP